MVSENRKVYRRIPPAELRDAVAESDRIIRPSDEEYGRLVKTIFILRSLETPARCPKLPSGPPTTRGTSHADPWNQQPIDGRPSDTWRSRTAPSWRGKTGRAIGRRRPDSWT